MSGGRGYPHGIGLVLPLLYVMALAGAMAEGKRGGAGAPAELPTQNAGVQRLPQRSWWGGVREARCSPSGDAVCFKCHADKQGPFAYEHLPVKIEGCGCCHTPHGSTNPRFLRVSQVNLTCLQCHSSPAAGPSGPAHNQSQKYQACTMCHPAIHGSTPTGRS